MSFTSRPCPLCKTPSVKNVGVFSSPRAETMEFDKLVPCWNGFFKDKVFFSYENCEKCGLLYAPVFFDDVQLTKLYAQMPPNMDSVPVDALRKTQRSYFDALKRHAHVDNDYLEIGADVGLFTENALREGQFHKYWLFEPNRAVWPALKEMMHGKNHEIVPDMFGFGGVPAHSVGVAVMIQVLDHLLDPVATLKELRQKLIPGGSLIVVTHDESSLLRRVFGRRWPAFCLQHPQLYNPTSMRAMMKAAGFKTVTIQKSINYFPLKFLFKHLLWALGIKVKNVPSFGDKVIGLKLGNMLTIAHVPPAP